MSASASSFCCSAFSATSITTNASGLASIHHRMFSYAFLFLSIPSIPNVCEIPSKELPNTWQISFPDSKYPSPILQNIRKPLKTIRYIGNIQKYGRLLRVRMRMGNGKWESRVMRTGCIQDTYMGNRIPYTGRYISDLLYAGPLCGR